MGKRWHPTNCKVCGASELDVGPISATGLCLEHSLQRMAEHNTQMALHEGPWFDRWRERMAASVGAAFLDEQRDEG